MIAVFGALEQEINELRKRMSVNRVFAHPNFRIYEGKFGSKEGLLVLTGMGKEKAQKAADYVLNKYPISVMISTGVGGGLNDKTTGGDFVLCSKMKCGDGEEEILNTDSRLVSLAENALKKNRRHYLVGTGITVKEVCYTPDSKRELAKKFAADVVDMESYWLGQIATKRNIPFVIIRPVFDTAHDNISLIARITSEGKVIPSKLIASMCIHPSCIRELISIGNRSRRIGKDLADFLMTFIEEIPRD